MNMKLGLPEKFKLIKSNDSTYGECFKIHDLELDIKSTNRTCLVTALDFLQHFVKNRELVKNIILPGKMRIEDKGVDLGFSLFNGDLFIFSSFNINDLILKANNKTLLDSKIEKLNNGEEIEV